MDMGLPFGRSGWTSVLHAGAGEFCVSCYCFDGFLESGFLDFFSVLCPLMFGYLFNILIHREVTNGISHRVEAGSLVIRCSLETHNQNSDSTETPIL